MYCKDPVFYYIYAHLYYPHADMYKIKNKMKGVAMPPKFWDAYLYNVITSYFKFWYNLGPTLYKEYYTNKSPDSLLQNEIKIFENYKHITPNAQEIAQLAPKIKLNENSSNMVNEEIKSENQIDITQNDSQITFKQIELMLDQVKKSHPEKFNEIKDSARTLRMINIDQKYLEATKKDIPIESKLN